MIFMTSLMVEDVEVMMGIVDILTKKKHKKTWG